MIDRLVLFGATGDLAGRFLLPALAALHAAGRLPDLFQVTGAAREELDDESFRRHAATRLEQHAADVPSVSREAVLRALEYRPVDLTDEGSVADVVYDVTGTESVPLAAYLALPPGLFTPTISGLNASRLPHGSRIVVEKPFGRNTDEAVGLNALLAGATSSAGDRAAYRVDHVLGMDTVRTLVGLRLADPVLAAVWDGTHIAQVDVLWEETLALEGRAGYYDTAGALRDVVQNHVLQVLSLVAMELPDSNGQPDLHDRQVDVLRAVRALTADDIATCTRRARYTAGKLADTGDASGNVVPDYSDEDGVDPDRQTETYAEVVLDVDTPRWHGTRFVLRAGKALAERRKGVRVQFRPVDPPDRDFAESPAAASQLWVGIDGPDELRLDLVRQTTGPARQLHPVVLTASPPATTLPPYANVLLDVLTGGDELSVRGDVAEQAWRLTDPIVEGWRQQLAPLEGYPAGSAGPAKL